MAQGASVLWFAPAITDRAIAKPIPLPDASQTVHCASPLKAVFRVQFPCMTNQDVPTEPVFRSAFRRDCTARMLVLRAADIDYDLRQDAGEFVLVVSAAEVQRARAELEAYERENLRPLPVPESAEYRRPGWIGVVIYAAIVVVVAVFRSMNFLGFDWFEAGKTHARSILNGEIWRTVTALTLHADVPHLVGNILFGGLFGLFVGQLLGSGLAWCSILFAGALGNLLNAWIREPEHTSIGASTAVFASLGLVAALAWMRRGPRRESRLARWTPIVGAVVLLSYLGTGGVRTDVFAHVAGFAAGLCLGIVYGRLGDRIRFGTLGQILLGMTTLLVVAVSWAMALTAQP